MKDNRISRRSMLAFSAKALGAVTVIPATALGRDGAAAASDRIVMGAIGIGGRGSYDLGCFLREPDSQFVAVCDVNTDGLPDVISSSAHGHGIFWFEQVREGDGRQCKQHEIDKSWSQAHSITLADIHADGDLDFVTGKRFMAHNGGDPDALGPLGVYWYELKPGPDPEWVKHAITYDEGIGAGLSIPVVDLDGDGDLDVVVTGKFGGPVWFENKLK